MSHLIRHIIHITVTIALALVFLLLNLTSEPWAWLFLLTLWFIQYILLSPTLKFKFWTRFIVTFLFWGISVFGMSFCMALIATQNNLKKIEAFGIILSIAYFLTTILLYEFCSASDATKESWLGRTLKRIFRKLIDPHDQGIQ